MKLNVQKQQLALTDDDDGSIWDQIIKRIECNEITINVLAANFHVCMVCVERQKQQQQHQHWEMRRKKEEIHKNVFKE